MCLHGAVSVQVLCPFLWGHFKGDFRFTAKLRRRHREFPFALCSHTRTVSPSSPSPAGGTCVTLMKLCLDVVFQTHSLHQVSPLELHSLCVQCRTRSSFALRVPCASLSVPPSPAPWNPLVFHCLLGFVFPRSCSWNHSMRPFQIGFPCLVVCI